VPVMACSAPPPSPTTLRIELLKNVGSKRSRPFEMTVKSSEVSGRSAITKAVTTSEVTRRSRA
jgi:hypothetical protein